ncbi:DUF742 domain-containing protein [Streptacidiphilus sp. MAP12-16]|uniref:DUF742 domain-containing protein n=1 Tax=Streptacidiphilus sp. MAP12-16 TaxID=3156300 RepID=UPI0035187E4B
MDDIPTDGPHPASEHGPDRRWYDDDAGPLVRLYALTRGRTRPASEAFDLIALITADSPYGPDSPYGIDPGLPPEPATILELCRYHPQSVAEIAADCDLPVGVVRVLLGDLLDAGLIHVSRPVPPAMLPDERILREVINGLQAL